MKKNLLLLPVLLATTFLSIAATTPNDTDPRMEKNFYQQFSGAGNVRWTKVEDGYSKVSFTWAGHRTEAYFNSDAQFVGSIRGLLYEQLPLNVIRAVDKRFNQPIVLEAREITTLEGTFYSLMIERKNARYKVRVDSFGNVEQEERIK